MATILDDINAISADSAALAAAQANLVTAQAAVTTAQAGVDDATQAETAADATLATALAASGPVFIANADGTVSVYAASSTDPGFTVTVAQPAANVPG